MTTSAPAPAILNIENLTLIGARLYEFATTIAPELPERARDIRLAARAADKLASLRFRVGESAIAADVGMPAATIS
jgi:hypothetical protein